MSLAVGFNTGINSLLAAQAALQTIGNNIANANTPGYAREVVLLGESAPVQSGNLTFGTGVEIADIRRIVDEGLEQRLLAYRAGLTRYQTERTGLQQMENIFSGAGGKGLSSLLGGVFSTLGSLASHPGDKTSRQQVITSGNDLARSLRDLSARLLTFRNDHRFDASLRVEQANQTALQIAGLNEQIMTLQARGADAHALLDRRQQLLNDLTSIIEVSTIAEGNGNMRVMVGGHTIVTGSKSFALVLEPGAEGQPSLRAKGGVGEIAAGSGAIAGLLRLSEETTPALLSKTDDFTKALILAFNRVHTTGVPASGGFEYLQGAETPTGGAAGATIPFSSAGYPAAIQKGELYINVQDAKTGDMVKTKISVEPSDTLAGFASKLSSIPHIAATIDAAGKLRISADAGYRFDFSARIDPNPDTVGSFGGASGALTSAGHEPFQIVPGSTLQIAVDGGTPQTIVFNSSQFADITKATAGEVAAAIQSQLSGAKAVAQHGFVALVSSTTGSTSTMQVMPSGTANGVFGFSTVVDAGSATAADAEISGTYSGSANDAWTFKPDSDGQIGVTPNLTIGVYDSKGNRISTLSVGEGYAPGSKLVVKDGIEVSFGPGEISNASNDTFSFDVVADSDTADVLSALGLNTFFTGNSAANVAVREDLLNHNELLASSLTGAAADAGNLNLMLKLESDSQSSLGDATLPGFITEMVSDLALDTKRAGDFERAQDAFVSDLAARREEVSGVSLEEEMANMVRFQQAFGAAGKFLRVLQDTTNSLIDLVR
jgi:flagellar hook-associated protein 1 FlgK